MRLTLEQLLQILPEAGSKAAAYLPHLLTAMAHRQINNPRRIAAFLAQIGHESGSLRYAREIWGPTEAQKRYDTRADLGNTPELDGDGKLYRGRGLIQITGLTNYRDCGNGLKVDLVQKPELLAQDEYAARSAAWFFATKGCMKYTGDLVRVTQIINGGQNGIEDRRARYGAARKALL